jgi:hypothetical protein
MPQRHWMEWRIAADAYSDEVPRKLAGAVVQFGLPWLARFIDFESIHAGSKTPMSRQASLVYRFVSRSLRREPA